MNTFATNLESSFCYLPSVKVTNKDLVERVYQRSDSEKKSNAEIENSIYRYTGIHQRRYCLESEASSDLAANALLPYLTKHPEYKDSISSLIAATTSGDHPSPATAHFTHRKLELKSSVHCFDVASSCSSFISAIRASSGLATINERNVVIAAEAKHNSLNKKDIRTLSLFADGAGGMVFKKSERNRDQFIFVHQQSDTQLVDNIKIPAGGSRMPLDTVSMDFRFLTISEPKAMYVHTVKAIARAIQDLRKYHTETYPTYSLGTIFVHQANQNILADVRLKIGESLGQKAVSLMADTGNMVCASIPVLRARVKFLHSILSYSSIMPSANEIVPLFKRLLETHAKQFSLSKLGAGLVFYTVFEGEEIYIYDDAVTDLNSSWLSRLNKEELEYICKNYKPQSSLQNVDYWVVAGGGFQTLGLLHTKVS